MTSARDPWLDNAKLALVTLVVIGHAWTLLPDNARDSHLYDFLYVWHVPAFVLVTGYLSKSFDYSPGRLWLLVRTVAVPYLIFECALALFRTYVGGERLQDLFADPHWPLWYLTALFCWRLLTPALRAIPAALAVAAAVSVVLGAVAPTTLDLARVVGFLPFFAMGLLATPERLALLPPPLARILAVPVLALIWLLTAHTDSFASTGWLYYRSTYADLGVGDLHGMVLRACLLGLGAAGALAFLALVPPIRTRLTGLGEMTLVVYLCHGFFVLGARYAGYETWTAAHPLLGLLVTTAAAIGVVLLLAWQPVSRVLRHLVDPLGYAQRRVRHAVELTAVADQVDDTDRQPVDSRLRG
ncbi:acyltransferase family protein [Nocardioides sp.]|uniref:acyltransferase family protein n=1 Tax=Nocardioides sp. TaxID=35761 RepID=UPI0039E2D5E3